MHASDPVPWRTWAPDVFDEARRRDRLVFVTVGFAACHWCHVLQHESFRDPEIAGKIAADFVPVLVDREERPDLDQELQAAMRAVSGQSGWPATLVLTPDGDVAFAAGYLPPRDGTGPGLLTVLTRLSEGWAVDRATFAAEAAANTARIRAASERRVPAEVDALLVTYRAAFDAEHGGFGTGPKFPNPPLLRLALDLAALGDPEWLRIATDTGRALAEGGLRDPIDGGFHRYTVDAAWQTPHFEKLAVENAQLATWFADLGALTGDPAFVALGTETLAALRAFERPDGSYANALDATGEGPTGAPIEGLFYTWTSDEVAALGPSARVLGKPVAGRLLVIPAPQDLVRYRAARATRDPPRADDLWLATTHAEVTRALVRGGQIDRALALAERILAHAVREDRVWRSGRPGLLEDQAAVAVAWLDLFEATSDPRWLDRAVGLLDRAEERFADPVGGWFRAEGEGLWSRPKDKADPSGTSVMIHAALRLAALTEAPRWRDRAERALAAGIGSNQPLVVDAAVLAARHALQIVIAWPEGADPSAMLAVRERVLPGRTIVAGPNAAVAALAGRVPLAEGKQAARAPTAWVCRRGVCAPPTTDPAALAALPP